MKIAAMRGLGAEVRMAGAGFDGSSYSKSGECESAQWDGRELASDVAM
jgi:hypothetical protein